MFQLKGLIEKWLIHTLIPQISILGTLINIFWGDLTDALAKLSVICLLVSTIQPVYQLGHPKEYS